jgi:hypothetical protein
MALKGAQEFVDDLIREVKPSERTAFALREYEPGPEHDFNWVLSMGPLSGDAKKRYESEIIKMRGKYSRLDWNGVTGYEGEWRVVQRWV